MSKRKKIIFTILTALLLVALVVSLAACKKPSTGKKDPKPDPSDEVENPGAEALNVAITDINKLTKELADGVEGGTPKIRLAADVSIDVDINKALAEAQLKGILGADFSMSKDLKVLLELGVDIVLDSGNPLNNIAMVNIAAKQGTETKKNLLSVLIQNEQINNANKTNIYIGETILHSNSVNWVKLDYPAVDYFAWLGEQLGPGLAGADIVTKFASGKFVNDLTFGPISFNAIKGLIPKLTMEGGDLQLLKHSKEGTSDKFAINFDKIGAVLDDMKGLIGNIDTSTLFASLDSEVESLLNGVIGLVLGADPNASKDGLTQLLKGEIKPADQPEVAILLHRDNDLLSGLGIHYDGNKTQNEAKKNGVALKIDIKNLKIENLNKKAGADAKSATIANFNAKVPGGVPSDIKPLAIKLEVDLKNLTTDAALKDNMFKGLEYAKLNVNIYPSAKLGWRKVKDAADNEGKYFAANVNETYAEALFSYKKSGATAVENALVGVMDFKGTEEGAKGLKLDLTPVFEALGATIPNEKTKAFMAWNFDLSNEITKMVEKKMAEDNVTDIGYMPDGLMAAPAGLYNEGTAPEVQSDLGKFIMEIIAPSGKTKFKLVADNVEDQTEVSATKGSDETYSFADTTKVGDKDTKITRILTLESGKIYKSHYIKDKKTTPLPEKYEMQIDKFGNEVKTSKIGNTISGVKFLLNNVLLKVYNGNFPGITTSKSDNFSFLTADIANVKTLYDNLMGSTGIIGGAGIYWYEPKLDENGEEVKGANGYVERTLKVLTEFLNVWNLNELTKESPENEKTMDIVEKIVGAKIDPDFWKQEGTSLKLGFNRTNGLVLNLELGVNGQFKGEDETYGEAKALKAGLTVKLDLVGEAMPTRKTITGWDDSFVLFGANNYDMPLTTEQSNAWREVINALLNEIWLPLNPIKPLTDITLKAEDGNFGMNEAEPPAEIKEKQVGLTLGGTAKEASIPTPNAPENKVFDKWTYEDGGTVKDFVYGKTIIVEEMILTAVYKNATETQ